jgi:hypothetical protein
MVRAFAGDSTITSLVPWPFPVPVALWPVPLWPVPSWEAAALPAALLLPGTLYPTSHPAPGPSRPATVSSRDRRSARRKYHTRRADKMPVPAFIPATEDPVLAIPGLHAASGGAQ